MSFLSEIDEENKAFLKWTIGLWLLCLVFLWICLWIWKPTYWPFTIDPSDLWNSLWIANSLVWALTLWLVYRTFKFQKMELESSKEILIKQELEMKSQRAQDLFVILLQTLWDHLKSVRVRWWYYSESWYGEQADIAQRGVHPDNPYIVLWRMNHSGVIDIIEIKEKWFIEWLAAVELLSNFNEEHIKWLVREWATSHFKKYLNTLMHIEKLIDERLSDDYLRILKSQINDSEIKLYHTLKLADKPNIPESLRCMDT